MREDIYFCLDLTESEHEIISSELSEVCATNGLELVYYRKLKEGHIPMIREIKVRFHSQLLGFRQVDNSAQDLIARSWAARVYDQFPTARYINLTGYDYHLPRQWEWAAGKRPTKERFFEIQFQTAE